MITLEICTQSFQAAIHAYHGGAHRIELCTDLPIGGLTPNEKLIRKVCTEINIPVFVLIRSRGGNFQYNESEINTMLHEIKRSIDSGANGIVCGALTDDFEIDLFALEKMIVASQGLPFTFHRAFEEVNDFYKSIDELIDLGVNRILTGGHRGDAYESRAELAQLNKYAAGRITILAGSGVKSENVASILKETQVREVHASAKFGQFAANKDDPNDTNPDEVRRLITEILKFN